MDATRALVNDARSLGGLLLEHVDDPHAELMALVWSSRFDREHAQSLLRSRADQAAALLQPLVRAADRYDNLPPHQQKRLRRLIQRHGLRGIH
jgi:hypothetical protein